MDNARLHLTDRQLYDLELLLVGGFAPLTGFLTEEEYNSVVDDMRLPSGKLWPMPIVLDVASAAQYAKDQRIILCDQSDNPLAYFTISSICQPDKQREAFNVYGTTDDTHPGVRYLMHHTGSVYLGGKIEHIALPHHYDFADIRRTPAELREIFAKRGWNKVAAFQTRNPVHRAHFTLMQRAHRENDINVLLHPVVGPTKEGDIDYVTRVKSYKQLYEARMKDFAELSLLPLAMRMAGPREALWHALIRKNYGCTHFIVGRDHAGPGKDKNGVPFYGPYDAQELALAHQKDLGIIILPQQEMLYVPKDDTYRSWQEIPAGTETKNISGTAFRSMLAAGDPVPEWFSFPEVVETLREGVSQRSRKGCTIFLTGLPSSGKSTIAAILAGKLRELHDRNVSLLDGDVVRQHLSKGLGFSREDRVENIKRIGFVASEITKHGGVAICSAIAPYAESRDHNRQTIDQHGAYIEVHVATPLAVCIERDVKGLYKKAQAGIIKHFTGIDDPYEAPENPEVTIDTTDETPQQSAEHIIELLRKLSVIK